MHRHPAISVLIVSRDRHAFLMEGLRSLRQQTFTDFEIVLVDDGSTESLGGLPVDKYLRTPPRGISHARNMAMRVADGRYYLIMDSDDWLHPECLAKEYARAEDGYDLVFCVLAMTDEQGRPDGRFIHSRVQNFNECLVGKGIVHPGSLFRASALQGIWYDEQFDSAVDYDFLLKFLRNAPRVGAIDQPLYYYRVHRDQERARRRQALNASHIRALYAASTRLTGAS